MTTDGSAITCPNCSRSVESGFKFCDYCGTRLESEPPKPEPEPEAPKPDPEPELPKPIPPVPGVVPPGPVPPPPPSRPGISSRPMKAEELRADQRGPGFAGRLQRRPQPEDTRSRDEEGSEPDDTEVITPPPPAWRPVDTDAPPQRSTFATVAIFAAHVLIAFVAGAVLLGIAAVVASLASDGSVALLEVRGLPIFIAGATAIIIFSLLRTGPRAKGGRLSVAVGVLIGFLILVGAVALAYRPSLMADAQRRLDRSLGIYGSDVADAVVKFEGDVEQWNLEVDNYRTDLLAVTKVQEGEPDPERRSAAVAEFRVAASGVEGALDGIQKRMVSHADAIRQAPLRESLRDLAAIFQDELGGIRLLTRGFVSNDQAMIKSGDTRFKDASARAVEFFGDRVRPILERAEIDPEPLSRAISELG